MWTKERKAEVRHTIALRHLINCVDELGHEDQRTQQAEFWEKAWNKAVQKYCPKSMFTLFPIN